MPFLNIVPHGKVEAALLHQEQTMKEQREYNTTFHTHAEITSALPDIEHCPPEQQPWILLSPWLDLILLSRGLQDLPVHRILLPGTFLIHLLHTSPISLYKGQVREDHLEDLIAYFPTTTERGDSIPELLQRQELFIRLDGCSLKDAVIGQGHAQSICDICNRLATSARGTHGIEALREASLPVYMFLFPWDDSISTELEYRVYCSPSASVSRIAAISQYKWHAPWHHGKSAQNHESIARKLVENCEVLFQRIVEHPSMTEELRSRGFSFDVVEDPAIQEVRLVELNDFGALSGCGACLFHWVRDARVLYGMEEDVEVRVSF